MVKTNSKASIVAYKSFTNSITLVKTNCVALVEKKELPPIAAAISSNTEPIEAPMDKEPLEP